MFRSGILETVKSNNRPKKDKNLKISQNQKKNWGKQNKQKLHQLKKLEKNSQ